MFKQLLKRAGKLALDLVKSEIVRIVNKSDRPADVKATATEEGVILEGRKLKRRAIDDPSIRDAAK